MIKIFVASCLISIVSAVPSIQEMSALLVQGIGQKTYDLHTNDNPSIDMDCLKVAYGKEVPVGVFHSGNITTHYSSLYYAQLDEVDGESNLGWKNQKKLSERGSQGTIFLIDGKDFILVSYELENHEKGNTLAIRFYENINKLRENNFLYEYQLDQFIDGKSVRNVGTPSIEKITLMKEESLPQFNQYQLSIKFHYSPDGSHDLPGEGFVNLLPLRDFVNEKGEWVGGCKQSYTGWRGFSDVTVLQVMRVAGCEGKIGQRDFFQVKDARYYLYECNLHSDFNWKNWRIFLYSPAERKAMPLSLMLDDVIDVANPHISKIHETGNQFTFLLTFFLPSEGIPPHTVAKPGEVVMTTTFTIP